jgi:hypothetical protein
MDTLLELFLLGFSGGDGVNGSLLLGFSGGGGFKGSLLFSFSLGNGSLDSLVYRSLFLSLEVSGCDSTKLEQVALVISLLSLVLLFKFISELLLSLSSFFQFCF